MGKSLNGKELGKGITQRKDGIYQARFTNRFGKRQTVYASTVTEITKKLREEQFKVRHNPRPGMEDLVFCSNTNNPINEANIRGAIRYLIRKIKRFKRNPGKAES